MFNFRKVVVWEPSITLHLSKPIPTTYLCKLRGLNRGALHVLSELPIAEASELTVFFGEAMLSGTVQYCRPKGGGTYLVNVLIAAPPGVSGRRDPRLPVNHRCAIIALGDKSSQQLQAVITDISASGMGLQIPTLLEVGTMVCVQTEGFLAAGEVLHCRKVDKNQFAVGIEITDMHWGE